jgi:hypothetical protein
VDFDTCWWLGTSPLQALRDDCPWKDVLGIILRPRLFLLCRCHMSCIYIYIFIIIIFFSVTGVCTQDFELASPALLSHLSLTLRTFFCFGYFSSSSHVFAQGQPQTKILLPMSSYVAGMTSVHYHTSSFVEMRSH